MTGHPSSEVFGAKARASVIGATGFLVRGLVIVLQIRSSGIPIAFISLT
jgi:hypothetical protein